jgi:hypothetical protein
LVKNKIMKNEKEIKKLKKAVEDINKRIDKLKEEKTKIEVNKWYKWGEVFIYVTSLPIGKLKGYGLDEGKWFDIRNDSTYWGFDTDNNFIPATNEEVEAALIAEAKKRGFKEGVKFNCAHNNRVGDAGEKFYFTDFKDHPVNLFCGDEWIFFKGQWAEIIKEPKVVINGYEMKQEGSRVKFGCAELDADRLKDIIHTINRFNEATACSNRNIKSITLDSGVEITVKQLQEIVKASEAYQKELANLK